ncbi:conserved hypothetical protein [Nitrosotalea sinensis]|uniref:Roadblock/LAMTOR2 domain-containing protein n=1 Tax=Nitrosotalea sinensis TaxID=1499975 RepID=A0A2H1EH47_9ARCH|nr:hypothetical protein [Candidatus Nitrosotalea sinensis]SHO45741.1 conserved hypothetical protein [Candidatus Nitrosotalea sinensis]
MNKKDAQDIVREIRTISQYVRFAGVVDSKGKIIAYERRPGHEPLLNIKSTSDQFSHLAIKTRMSSQFNKQLGDVKFMWEEREKVQTISFAVGKNTVWVSIDKKVIRSEVLRIIDNCLPIVKQFS